MEVKLIDHMGSDLSVVNSARVSFNKDSFKYSDLYIEVEEGAEIPDWFKDISSESDLNKALAANNIKIYDESTNEIYHDSTKSIFRRVRDTEKVKVFKRKGFSTEDKKLIKYLATHNHFTPFTHCTITLREKVPIFVARQRFKHQIGFSYNEVSRRYVDYEPEFYTPEEWRAKADNKKQGSEEGTDIDINPEGFVIDVYQQSISRAMWTYEDLLRRGVCPEQARMVLPQSTYTEYWVTGSLAAWARAYNLRSKPDAQKEIRDLASMWNDILSELYPYSWKELTQNED